MIANHTSMAQLFGRTVKQFDVMYKKKAYIAEYRKEPMFQHDLSEFDSAHEVAMDLIAEYKAAEKMDYVTWGSPEGGGGRASDV